MSVSNIFLEAKESIDDIFGEGYAAANPLLVDRFVQQVFKSNGNVAVSASSSNSFTKTVAPIVAAALKNGELLPGLPYVEQIATKKLCRHLAGVLEVPVTHGLHMQVGRFMSSVFGARSSKLFVSNYERPHVINLPPYPEGVKIFSASTGLTA